MNTLLGCRATVRPTPRDDEVPEHQAELAALSERHLEETQEELEKRTIVTSIREALVEIRSSHSPNHRFGR